MSSGGMSRATGRRRLVPLPIYLVVAGIAIIGLVVGGYFLFRGKAGGAGPAKPSAERQAAEDAYASADYEKAIELYRGIVERDADDLEAHRSLAQALAAAGRNEEAIATYAAIVEKTPGDADSLVAMAAIEQLIGKTADAIAHYEAAIAASPQPDYLRMLAPVYAQVGRWAESIQTWERYLQLATLDRAGQASVYAAIAASYENTREYDKAVEALEQALFLDPNNEAYETRLAGYGDQ